MNIEVLAERAEMHISAHEVEGRVYAKFASQEIDYETQRLVIKARLIETLIGTDNPATGKPHSASSAEQAAAVHPDYVLHLKLLSDTVRGKNNACAAMYSARLRASLAVALIKSEINVA